MLLKRIVKSPLLHFFILGGLVFALYAVMNPGSETSEQRSDRIVLSPETASQLATKLSETWGRAPERQDIEAAMEAWVVEEALVREAQALGLDDGDEVIRNRLQQKLLYLAEAPAAAQEPDDGAIEAFYNENAERFTPPGQISFQHVLLPSQATSEEIAAALDQLKDGAEPETVGAPRLIPPIFEDIPLAAVDKVFGGGFSDQIKTLPEGEWSGPVKSGFGPHLVYVYKSMPGELPALETVRDKVVSEWRAEQTRLAREAFVDAILTRYEIEIPSVDEVLLP